MTILRCLGFLLVAFILAAAPAQARGVDEILAAHRTASGEIRTSGSVRLVYSYDGQGLTGTVTIRFDPATGAYLVENDLGLVRTASGYDGRTPWMRDFSGANTTQEGGDRVRLAVNEAYRYANLWWRPDRGGARITFVGRETADGRQLDRLRVEPVAGEPFDAWFDSATGLLARIAERQMFFNTRPGNFAEVDSNVESIRLHDFS